MSRRIWGWTSLLAVSFIADMVSDYFLRAELYRSFTTVEEVV